MANVSQVIDRLITDAVVGDLWVNGSFLTEKIDPDDVDVVLRMEAAAYDFGTHQTQAAVDWLSGNLYASHNVDSYVFFVWPPGHQHHAAGQSLHDYWLKQFGRSRPTSGAIPKGIAELKLMKVGP